MTTDTSFTPPALTLSAEAESQIRAHGEATYPHECCGYLVGPTLDRVTGTRRLTNTNTTRAHDRYELDPLEQMRIEREVDDAGLVVAGVYHSHPDHPARPSETDRLNAVPGWSFVIVQVLKGKSADLTSWQLDTSPHEGGSFFSQPLTIEP